MNGLIITFVTALCAIICIVLCCIYCKEDQSIVNAERDDRANVSYVEELKEKCRQVATGESGTRETEEIEMESKPTKVHEKHQRKGSHNYRNAEAKGPIRAQAKHVI